MKTEIKKMDLTLTIIREEKEFNRLIIIRENSKELEIWKIDSFNKIYNKNNIYYNINIKHNLIDDLNDYYNYIKENNLKIN